jgi:hypothetical protein
MGEYSDRIRVVGADAVERWESDGPVPEVVTLGADLTYEVLYDGAGVLAGAIRFVDPDLTTRCRDGIRGLYSSGEEIGSFVNREVACLSPPYVGSR